MLAVRHGNSVSSKNLKFFMEAKFLNTPEGRDGAVRAISGFLRHVFNINPASMAECVKKIAAARQQDPEWILSAISAMALDIFDESWEEAICLIKGQPFRSTGRRPDLWFEIRNHFRLQPHPLRVLAISHSQSTELPVREQYANFLRVAGKDELKEAVGECLRLIVSEKAAQLVPAGASGEAEQRKAAE